MGGFPDVDDWGYVSNLWLCYVLMCSSITPKRTHTVKVNGNKVEMWNISCGIDFNVKTACNNITLSNNIHESC